MGLCSTWKKHMQIGETDKGWCQNDQKVTYRPLVIMSYHSAQT